MLITTLSRKLQEFLAKQINEFLEEFLADLGILGDLRSHLCIVELLVEHII